jgi:hypothetical protein
MPQSSEENLITAKVIFAKNCKFFTKKFLSCHRILTDCQTHHKDVNYKEMVKTVIIYRGNHSQVKALAENRMTGKLKPDLAF